MKKLLIIALLAFGSFQVWQKYSANTAISPSYDQPYVTVYGRDSCGYTNQILSKLERRGVNYYYHIVDDKDVADTLHARMEASGISTRRYNLPVVEVNGHLSVRPDFQSVLDNYNEPL